jgi:hypothetical protein
MEEEEIQCLFQGIICVKEIRIEATDEINIMISLHKYIYINCTNLFWNKTSLYTLILFDSPKMDQLMPFVCTIMLKLFFSWTDMLIQHLSTANVSSDFHS